MKKAFFCAPGELSMSLLMKCGETWGWKESFKIKFPLQLGLWVLFFFKLFLRGTFRCRARFLVEYLKMAVDTNLQFSVLDLCNFWCTKPLGPKKRAKGFSERKQTC